MTAFGPDARIARRLLVLADREEIAAEDRTMQHDPMTMATTMKMTKLCGTPKLRPVVSHSRVGKLWPNSKPAVPSSV